MTNNLLSDLSKAKAIFQQRAVLAALGVNQSDVLEQCGVCGDHHEGDVPFTCANGDGE
ncbi:hypothetical protein [Zavarzinella formosa]|uniref:hypothetical protein n=1 Tax=Zavarzinella formosa TaxID=360055 RepID=UPI0002E4370E|nr:hypothetical protein [Zavarzinella formosa]